MGVSLASWNLNVSSESTTRRSTSTHLHAARKRLVFFDVQLEFLKRSRADAAQLAASKHRLQEVRGVHGAVCFSGANHEVHFVDEPAGVLVWRRGLCWV